MIAAMLPLLWRQECDCYRPDNSLMLGHPRQVALADLRAVYIRSTDLDRTLFADLRHAFQDSFDILCHAFAF